MMNERVLERREHAGLQYLLQVNQRSDTDCAPVIVFLHGYDEGAPMAIERALTRHGPLRFGNPHDALAPFIIVAPQLPVRGDTWYEQADTLQSLVRQIQQEHCGDRSRTYLTGFSFGGNGVFDLALARPDMWAALWAVDPTRVPTRDPQRPVWLSFGEIARHRKAQFVATLALRRAGGGDRVYVDGGHDHVGAAMNAYRDAKIYGWLLSKRLVR